MLRARHLRLTIGPRTLIDGLDLEVEAGETVAVLGATGSGKTTLLRALAWLHPLTSGELFLAGRSVAGWGVCEWRRRVAYVPQQPPSLPTSADANLERISGFRAQRPHTSASQLRARALEFSRRWQVNDACWQAEFGTLSGGERQRVYLATVLATSPDVLLLDEPTSALDEETKLLVEVDFSALTSLWVTHDRGQAERVANSTLELG